MCFFLYRRNPLERRNCFNNTYPYILQGSKYSSKRDYEREASSRSTNYMRDRDNSPSGANNLNNGTNSYRSDSPELDSPRESRDRDRRDRYQSSSYIQKMKDRDRDRDYKKDKYTGTSFISLSPCLLNYFAKKKPFFY